MKTKTDKGIQRGGKRLLIDHISNYLSPLAAKPALLQVTKHYKNVLPVSNELFLWAAYFPFIQYSV